MVLFVFEMPESGYSRSNISIEFFIINWPTGANIFATVKTFDANTENIGDFVLMWKIRMSTANNTLSTSSVHTCRKEDMCIFGVCYFLAAS